VVGGSVRATVRPVLGSVVVVGAAVTTAVLAGTFSAFTVAVVPGLARTDPRGAIGTMQEINLSIVNPWFMAAFLGAPVLLAGTLALEVLGPQRGAVIAGHAVSLGLVTAALVVTAAVNIPLNDGLAAAGDPAGIADPAGVRDAFLRPWARWNLVRALCTTVATGVLAATTLGAR
jgi:uncharacterized membrane protein